MATLHSATLIFILDLFFQISHTIITHSQISFHTIFSAHSGFIISTPHVQKVQRFAVLS